jgi:RNA polymerase sigma-70 factor (ECF subfamily)
LDGLCVNDLALARRVLAGDESAAEEFFAEYFPRVYRFARLRLGGLDAAAEDVAQAALIRAVRKLHTYRGEAALFTWLCTLCRQEIGLWRQRSGRVAEMALLDELPDVRLALDAAAGMAATDPEQLAARRELAAFVHLTLDQLPARYGQALEWKYLQGHSTEEIARRMGIGYKAAESLLTRAREAFRNGFAVVASEAS